MEQLNMHWTVKEVVIQIKLRKDRGADWIAEFNGLNTHW